MKSVLGLFGLKKPLRTTDTSIDVAVRDWQRRHAEQVECLVCKMIEAGHRPETLEIVNFSRGLELVVQVRVREKTIPLSGDGT